MRFLAFNFSSASKALALAVLATAAIPVAAQPEHSTKCGLSQKCMFMGEASAVRYVNDFKRATTSRIEVSARDAQTGHTLPLFRAPGHLGGGWYLAGVDGASYELVVRNQTGRRLLVVPSVDGVNVITGQTASPHQSGYILEPYQSVTIEGWRKSLNEVARFVFSSPSDSYASQTDRPANVGVIGFAVFEERAPVVAPLAAPGIANSVPGAAREDGVRAKSAAPSLGTAHGEREISQARRGEFNRASNRPAELLRLDYERVDVLVRKGVAVLSPRETTRNPFPAQEFVPDPPAR